MAAIVGLFETVFHTCVRGYHVYQDVWVPATDEMLSCCREVGNPHDPFAVKVTKAGITVGHLPKKISSTCSLFIFNGGSISCEVTDSHRRYSSNLVQGGLEIIIRLQGTKELIDKVSKLLGISSESNASADKKPTKKQTDITDASVTPAPDAKRIKLESEADQNVWVTFTGTRIQLFTEDKRIIVEQERLNDRHINFAQAVLRAQFPWCDGLQNSLLQDRLRFSVTSKIVQILHIRGNHWMVISNVYCDGNNVNVYDTVYDNMDSSTLDLLNSMFEEDVTFSNVEQLEKQQGDVDCGVFCIAIATSLLHGLTPTQYNQSLMRHHLVHSFEAKTIQPFT